MCNFFETVKFNVVAESYIPCLNMDTQLIFNNHRQLYLKKSNILVSKSWISLEQQYDFGAFLINKPWDLHIGQPKKFKSNRDVYKFVNDGKFETKVSVVYESLLKEEGPVSSWKNTTNEFIVPAVEV